MAKKDVPDVLSYMEVESFCENLGPSDTAELGSIKWIKKHHILKQLGIQATIQAMSNREESVKEALITFEKLPVILQDALMIEAWRETILEEILAQKPTHTLMIYPILYHEAVAIALLSTTLFHSEAFESLGDAVVDLVDYCSRAINRLLFPVAKEVLNPNDGEGDFLKQRMNLLTGISYRSITCLRYVIGNLDSLGKGIISRLTVSTDTPLTLTDLLIKRPWRSTNDSGKVFEYSLTENDWKPVKKHKKEEDKKLSQFETQIWLSIYMLFKNKDFIASYELFDSRKQHLLKLRSRLHQGVLEQIPFLSEFQVFLEQLSISNAPFTPNKKALLIELVPEITTKLRTLFETEKSRMVQYYTHILVTTSPNTVSKCVTALSEAYNLDDFEALMPEVNKCGFCGEEANRKCSKCQKVWYCQKSCQVKDWKKHKPLCKQK